MKTAKLKKNQIWQIIIKKTLILILILISVYNLVYLFYSKANKDFSFSGRTLLVVNSNSMYPTLNQKDLVIVEEKKKENINQDDVIVHSRGENYRITRVIRIRENKGIVSYLVKGDNNLYLEEILSDTVQGKVIGTIPEGNILINILRLLGSPVITVIIIIYVILLIRYKRRVKLRNKKKGIEDNYTQFKNII